MAKLNLPFIIEQLDILLDNELEDNGAEPGTDRELNILNHLSSAITDHLANRVATSGAGYVEPEANAENGYVDPAGNDEDFTDLEASFDQVLADDFEEGGPFADAQAAQEYLDAEAAAS